MKITFSKKLVFQAVVSMIMFIVMYPHILTYLGIGLTIYGIGLIAAVTVRHTKDNDVRVFVILSYPVFSLICNLLFWPGSIFTTITDSIDANAKK